MELELVDPTSFPLEPLWRALESAAPPAYVLSWGWIESWLACLPRAHVPALAIVRDAGVPIAACFLGRQLLLRPVPRRALYLNTTGVRRLDELWIEYNGVLGRDLGLAELVALLPRGWDELHLPGVAPRAFGGLSPDGELRIKIDRRVPAYYVDLARVRAEGYLALLSGQTRNQVRRARREAGDVALEIARTSAEALDIYGELTELHGAQWRARGKPGAFADPWFDRFHRRLIARRFAHGEIQLLRVRHARGTIGCLYNHVFRGRVLQYQSGVASYENPHLKPGFVCHAAAIEHAAAHGLEVYDFLGGDMRYKKSLSTGEASLLWARVQRPRLRFLVEDRVRAWRARRHGPPAP